MRRTGNVAEGARESDAVCQTYGGATVGDRTMIDALVPANEAPAGGEGLPARRKWHVRVPGNGEDGSCRPPFLLPERPSLTMSLIPAPWPSPSLCHAGACANAARMSASCHALASLVPDDMQAP